jgi:Serine proteases of the peptidase family S9A
MRGIHSLLLLATLLLCTVALAQISAGDSVREGSDSAKERAAGVSAATTKLSLPSVKQVNVQETLHGVAIRDPYRYLENSSSPETQQYVSEEMAYTRSLLDPLPGRDAIHSRVEQLLSIGTITAPQIGKRDGTNLYFYTRREGKQNQPILYVREGVNGSDRALVDVNARDTQGTTALDWWYPTHDGKYVCFGTSENGSEISDLQIIESATGKLLPEKIARSRAASVAWKHDNSGFFYTRYPRTGEAKKEDEAYYRRVFYHQLGAAPDGSADKLIFSYDKDPQGWPNITISDDDRWLLIGISQGWTKVDLFLKDLHREAPPLEITQGKDFLYSGEIYKGSIYLTSNENAPRFRLFRVDTANPQREHWREIVPQTRGARDAVLQNESIIGGKLLLNYQKDVVSQLKTFDLDGKYLGEVRLPAIGSVTGIGGLYDTAEAFFEFQSFTVPPSVYRVNMASDLTPTSEWQALRAPIDPSKYEVKQVFYASKDGTKIPMFIITQRGVKLDGSNPTWLTGYGGFNVSMSPAFNPPLYVWLEHGGVFAMANLRGGAEYGEDWHRAGMLEHKQNVFDDFISAAKYLIAQKYTSKEKLAITGGSNGGLLMGAAFTQRPDLFRAVVCQVPLLDMLRYQNFQIAKLWIPEYGSAEDPEQFKWLYAYSPYHHVKQGAEYPAILFLTADTDTRVDPMHAKKMAALMQSEAANGESRDRPILLRIETKAGHGAGKPISKQVEERVDIFSFLFWQLGMQN